MYLGDANRIRSTIYRPPVTEVKKSTLFGETKINSAAKTGFGRSLYNIGSEILREAFCVCTLLFHNDH